MSEYFHDDLLDFVSLIESEALGRIDESNTKEHFYFIKCMDSPSFSKSNDHFVVSRAVLAYEEKIIRRTTEDDWFAVINS
jgi:hypothetical protein